jgi:hypothetical protein
LCGQPPKHDEQIRELQAMIREHGQQIHQTSERIEPAGSPSFHLATLAGAVAKISDDLESHARRLERFEGHS